MSDHEDADTAKHKPTPTRIADAPAPKTTDPSKPKPLKPGQVAPPKPMDPARQAELTDQASLDGFRTAMSLLARRMNDAHLNMGRIENKDPSESARGYEWLLGLM